jgi:hypothetical protein
MIARYHSICRHCKAPIQPGQHIAIPRTGQAVHSRCAAPAGPDPKPIHQADPELQAAKLRSCERAGWR